MPGLTNNVVYVNRNLLGVDDNGNILQLGLPVGDGTLRLPEVVVKPSYIPTYNDIENQFGRKVTLQDIDNTIAMDPRIKLETPSIPTEKGMVSLTFLSPFVRMAFIDAPAAAANYTVNKFGLPAVAPYAPMPTDGEALFDLPAYGSVANVLKQGTKGAAKMFSNWATEREIKNTINLRIKSWDTTLPNHTISLGNGRLQFRTPTYQVYTGPKHSISEIINPDGSVNIKNILKVLNDALENIPGGTIARHRLENKDFHKTDWNTFLHSRDAYQRAMAAQYPEEARFPVLMHDFGKMWAGDGHGPYGASILEQMFPDATKELIAAIAEHMDSMPQSALGKLVKGADISENNQFRNDVKNLTSLIRRGRNVSYIDLQDGMPYALNVLKGAWDSGIINSEIQKGRQELINWVNSPEFIKALLLNEMEAQKMGLNYTPLAKRQTLQERLKLLDNPSTYKFYVNQKAPENGFIESPFGDYGTQMNINLANTDPYRTTIRHEGGHMLGIGGVDLPATNPLLMKNELEYLRYKTRQVLKPGYEYNGLFDLSEYPYEAVLNLRDLGQELGLKVGLEYPGYDKALNILSTKVPSKLWLMPYLKTDKESMPYLWKALVGTQFASLPLYLNFTNNTNNE